MAIFDRLIGRLSPDAALKRAIRLTEQGQAERAFPLLTEAARAGLPEAEYKVGRCYLEGAGVPFSRSEAARWLERAASPRLCRGPGAAGDAVPAWLCGRGRRAPDRGPPSSLFAGSQPAEPDFESAAKWARQAAEAGSADGQAVLAYILTSGPETLRNLTEADTLV